ncbi:MAG: glycosyltransferase family 2 protein [Acidimicrobiales bacterium]
MLPSVRVVIVDHDGGARTLAAIASVIEDPWAGPREVVLVDNASRAPAVDAVHARYPEVVIRLSTRNLGFAGGCNLGIGDPSEVDLIALVNNDATVTPGWLESLAGALSEDQGLAAAMPKVVLEGEYRSTRIRTPGGRDGLVRLHEASVAGIHARPRLRSGFLGPEGVTRRSHGYQRLERDAELFAPVNGEGSSTLHLLLSSPSSALVHVEAGGASTEIRLRPEPTGVDIALEGPRLQLINSTGVFLTADQRGADRGWLEIDDGRWDDPGPIEAWSGSAVLLRASHLLDVGLFDESLFLYWEDVELAWRAARHGWRFAYVPAATARHVHSATAIEGSPLATYHVERNRLLVLSRHAPARVAWSAALRAIRVLGSYVVRDIFRPPFRLERPSFSEPAVRARALAGYARRLPGALRARFGDRHRFGRPWLLGSRR